MPLPISKRQVELLGKRLAAGDAAPEDTELLHRVLEAYAEALRTTRSRVVARTGASATSRVKNTGTIREKLRRNDGRGLSTIQDLAGARVVLDGGRAEQDSTVSQLVDEFETSDRPVKVVDRRSDPRSGYRAVHLVVSVDGLPVEIQLRTDLQHRWAELFEKLADEFGRGIRYGQPPELLLPLPAEAAAALSPVFPQLDMPASLEELMTQHALAVSDTIDLFETEERRIGGKPAVSKDLAIAPDLRLEELRSGIHHTIEQFGAALPVLSRLRQRRREEARRPSASDPAFVDPGPDLK